MRIKDLGTISAPEARTLVIQPWDKGLLGDIEKGISQSDLGVSPVNDGNVIRITLPEMSSQRRDELAKLLGKKLEEARIAVRNIRKDFHNLIRDSEKKKNISEDHGRRLTDSLQQITDTYIKKLEEMADKKEKDIKAV
jgi:ribosome recycling factor